MDGSYVKAGDFKEHGLCIPSSMSKSDGVRLIRPVTKSKFKMFIDLHWAWYYHSS